MIKTSTVFVLGAGSSFPYGLPLGPQLRQVIIEAMVRPLGSKAGLAVVAGGFGMDHIQKFAEAFSRSGMASIDAFLTRRPEFADVGKMAIAAVLSGMERSDPLFAENTADHWYRLLWNAMMRGAVEINDTRRNAIKFVTFNYDRSLEHFLHHSIANTWGVDGTHAFTQLRDVPMLHVYGSLGPYHYQANAGHREYGSDEQLQLAASSIHVIPELRKDDVFIQARKWFGEAKRICFLGFGFDPLNMERLGLYSVLSWLRDHGNAIPEIYATTLGRTATEVQQDQIRLIGKEHWQPVDVNCSSLLRNTPLLFDS